MGPSAEKPGNLPTTSTRHPIAFFFFFWGEFAERASYYGMRAILFLYLTSALRFSDPDGSSIFLGFKMACYFLPLVGGFIADRYLGKYWTIVGFSVPYVLGHFILGIPNEVAMFLALALLAGGAGVIKPNISTLMGQTYDQQRPGQAILRTAAFQWFYFAINVGALISSFAMPLIRNKSGYAIAFQFPAWLMVGALLIFAAGRKYYAVETFEKIEVTDEYRRQRWETLKTLFGFFVLMICFWIPYEHNDTLWVAFSRDYVDRHLPITGKEISPDQLQFVNPLFVLILIPVFNGLFKRIDPQIRIFTPFLKILLGFALTAAAAGVIALAGFQVRDYREEVRPIADQEAPVLEQLTEIEKQEEKIKQTNGDLTEEEKVEFETRKAPLLERKAAFESEKAAFSQQKVSFWWMVVSYIVLTVGEVLLYGTGLELAYTMAPKNMKGFITACFLVTNALGNLINMRFARLYGGSLVDATDKLGPLPPGEFFGVSALIALAGAVAFFFIGNKLGQPDSAEAAPGEASV